MSRCKSCNTTFYPTHYRDRFDKIQFEEVCDYCRQLGSSSVSSEEMSEVYNLDLAYKHFLTAINSEKGSKEDD